MEFQLLFNIISGFTSIISLTISIYGIIHNRFLAVNEYLTKVEDPRFIAAKRHVYNKDIIDTTDENAAIIVNFFHHWGMLAKKHYLPMWVFNGATGNGVCRLYERTEQYIQKRQEKNQDFTYGEYFKWLYKKIKKKQTCSVT